MEISKIEVNDIRSYFESLKEEELTDEKLLAEFILKRVGLKFTTCHFNIDKGHSLSRGYKLKIWHDELARFLLFMYSHKNEINSYLEFGTGSGGTFYVIDSYLRTINKNMGQSVTVDKKPPYPYEFEIYKSKNPQVNYYSGSTTSFKMDREYDLCFIDANHKYRFVRNDYKKVKDYCRFIAFHDIVANPDRKPNQCSTHHLWQEIKAKNKIEIITTDSRIKRMAGIGIIWD
jgi:hypothetical protein